MSADYYQNRYRIAATRLTGYDYGANGMYFVTICTRDKWPYFGEIILTPTGATLQPTSVGQLAIDFWLQIPNYHPYVELDAFQLMPDHLHAVLWICKMDLTTTEQVNRFGPQRQNLASIIRGYKSAVSRETASQQIEFGWQPRYYDRVIRSDDELNRGRTYIEDNPARWEPEQLNPENLYM